MRTTDGWTKTFHSFQPRNRHFCGWIGTKAHEKIGKSSHKRSEGSSVARISIWGQRSSTKGARIEAPRCGGADFVDPDIIGVGAQLTFGGKTLSQRLADAELAYGDTFQVQANQRITN